MNNPTTAATDHTMVWDGPSRTGSLKNGTITAVISSRVSSNLHRYTAMNTARKTCPTSLTPSDNPASRLCCVTFE